MPRAQVFFVPGRRVEHSRSFNPDDHPASQRRKLSRIPLGYILSLMLIFVGSYGLGVTITPSLLPRSQAETTSQTIKSIAPEQVATLDRSIPIHLDVPSVGISADITELGRNSDNTLSAPDDYSKAGWYRDSPTPGEVGPSIITGHVDNYLGPAVFYPLKDVRQGDRIQILRKDGETATFAVDAVKIFDQAEFPTQQVYGNIEHAGLRLITCGGIYNPLTNHYSQNVVVYASLVSDKSDSSQIKNADR